MKNQKGFIQISLLIAIVTGVLVLGGSGYLGIKQYQSNKVKPIHEDASTAQTKRVVLSNSEIADRVKPATVFIETTEGTGSGMIIDSHGYVLTNAHVVYDVSVAKVKLSDERTLSASVEGRDEIMDLAVLKITGNNFPKVDFGNSDTVAQGDDVFTFGYPFGLEGDVSFKEGTISRKISDGDTTYLETSAEIHPGNSGGPLVNKYGEVIGVNTAALGQSIKGITVGETIKFAIPINVAKSILPDLKTGRKIIIEHTKPQQSGSGGSGDSMTDFVIKAQCASYKGTIEKIIQDKNYQYSLGSQKIYSKLMEIFYSPIKNSCLYSEISYVGDIDEISTYFISYTIYDYLQNENIFWRPWPPVVRGNLTWTSQPNKAYEQYVAEKKRLMGE